jgi:hypothetical protein
MATDHASVANPLACLPFGAHVFQSLVHRASVSALAVAIRLAAFAVQMAIGLYRVSRLRASA